jgi:hypothetical protein
VSTIEYYAERFTSPHHRFEAIVRGVDIPMINLFEEVAAQRAGIGLLVHRGQQPALASAHATHSQPPCREY